jgi:hypothetical protein
MTDKLLLIADMLRAKSERRMKELPKIRDMRVKDSNYAVARAEVSIAETIEQILSPPAHSLDSSSPEMSDVDEDCRGDVLGEL